MTAAPGLRVLHLSTYDRHGGAAKAAFRLHRGLLERGISSNLMVLRRSSDDASLLRFTPPVELSRRLARRLRRRRIRRDFQRYRQHRPPGLEPFSDDRTEYGSTLLEALPEADVVNLHWVAGLVDYGEVLPRLSQRASLVWRLADLNPLTGGCHYDGNCGRFSEQCGCCPQLGSHHAVDLSRQVWRRKRRALSSVPRDRLHIVALSTWMAQLVSQSSLLEGYPVSIIPNGVDLDRFQPRDRTLAREVLGLRPGDRVILFVADAVDNPRKGLASLQTAVTRLGPSAHCVLLSVGRGRPRFEGSLRQIHLGQVEQPRLLSLCYSAADLCLLPSLEDNFPNTALEAIACGTPIVAFAVGGAMDVVREGVSGKLVPVGNAEALAAALGELLENRSLRDSLRESCRQLAVDEYSRELQVERYLNLYASVAGPATSSSAVHPAC